MKNTLLIHDPSKIQRWEVYLKEIKSALDSGKGAIFLAHDLNSLAKAQDALKKEINFPIAVLQRRQGLARNLEEWKRIKNQEARLILGVRSGIFAPVKDLGLIIIDEEQSPFYKEDRQPHYHAREVAFMLSEISQARLVLGSSSPSLEMYYLAQEKKIEYLYLKEQKKYPLLKMIDLKAEYFIKNKGEICGYLQNRIAVNLQENKKIVIFLNRRGFATSAFCRNCSFVLRCPRCNVNLVYHFKENSLICHYCNYQAQPPQICPNCNVSYIRYSGSGVEKIDSELHRIFPQARIAVIDKESGSITDADIFVSTQYALQENLPPLKLIAILGIDNALGRNDFRAAENVFGLLTELVNMGSDDLIIQTHTPRHYCFESLLKNDSQIFYRAELRSRKQLGFPPYRHFILVKLRGKDALKVKDLSAAMFEGLKKDRKDKGIEVIALNPATLPQMRGNFYWQILLKVKSPVKAAKFLKMHLKEFSRSGITITVDVDPI